MLNGWRLVGGCCGVGNGIKPIYNQTYSQAISQGLVAFLLIWALF